MNRRKDSYDFCPSGFHCSKKEFSSFIFFTASANDFCQNRFPRLILVHLHFIRINFCLFRFCKNKDRSRPNLTPLFSWKSSADQHNINGSILLNCPHLHKTVAHLYLKSKFLFLHQKCGKSSCILLFLVTDHQTSAAHIISLLLQFFCLTNCSLNFCRNGIE